VAEPERRVAIVGGGFSGAMLAARLAECGVASVLIERQPVVGPGVAYSTPFDGHLLNVRSGRMSALDGAPDHFVDWLGIHHPDLADPEAFAPRRVYGDYIRDRLAAVEATHPGGIERVRGEVTAIAPDGVRLADETPISARAVVLATGNPPPRTAGDAAAIIADPWAPTALDRIGPEDDLVIIGTGLTMVDMVLMLDSRGWRGRATALSRRGLLPRPHLTRTDCAAGLDRAVTSGPLSQRLRAARRVAGAEGWRGLMECLRPLTADLWAEADPAMRARFVRHLRPWWDVHRHRLAPVVAATIDRLITEDRLTLMAGRVRRIDARDDGVAVDWTARSGAVGRPLTGRWLIDCTGPGHDPAADPLTGPLLASGRARLDTLRLGLDLDPSGRVVDAQGRANPGLYVLGPPARAAFWETIAVPDIRKRIEDVAAALTT